MVATTTAVPAAAPPPDPASSSAPQEEKQLSGAELKRKMKEEKAARRAQVKQDREKNQPPHTAPPPQGASHPAHGTGAKQRPEGPQSAPQASQPAAKPAKVTKSGKPAKTARFAKSPTVLASTAPSAKKRLPARPALAPRNSVPECFSHLARANPANLASPASFAPADKAIHPAIARLGQHMRSLLIKDNITRVEATLMAFGKIIGSYETPAGHAFYRHFNTHVLASNVHYLAACRPLSFGMENVIRWLTKKVSTVDIDLPDHDVRMAICDAIDTFVHERVRLADFVLVRTASAMIHSGDRVVVFGSHHLICSTILKAVEEDRKTFSLVIIDDPHEPAGKALARWAAALRGVRVTYCADLACMRWVFGPAAATLVLVAAEAVFGNGGIYAPAGTCDVAVAAHEASVPVVALCESVSVCSHVAIDSVAFNEIDPAADDHDGFRLMFDVTPARYVSRIITELGTTRPDSVFAILPKLDDL